MIRGQTLIVDGGFSLRALMEPTDHNRRAFDDAHRTQENVLSAPAMPERIRERLHGANGSRVLHLLCGTGRESLDLARAGSARDRRRRRRGRDRDGAAPAARAAVGARRRPRTAAGAAARTVGPRLPRLRVARPPARARCVGRRRRGGAADRRRAAAPRRAPGGRLPDAFGRWRGDYFAVVRARRARHRGRALRAWRCAGSRSGPARTRRCPRTSCSRRRRASSAGRAIARCRRPRSRRASGSPAAAGASTRTTVLAVRDVDAQAVAVGDEPVAQLGSDAEQQLELVRAPGRARARRSPPARGRRATRRASRSPRSSRRREARRAPERSWLAPPASSRNWIDSRLDVDPLAEPDACPGERRRIRHRPPERGLEDRADTGVALVAELAEESQRVVGRGRVLHVDPHKAVRRAPRPRSPPRRCACRGRSRASTRARSA